MFLFCKKEISLLLFIQLCESLESAGTLMQKVLGKVEKSWKFEFESIFLVGTMITYLPH